MKNDKLYGTNKNLKFYDMKSKHRDKITNRGQGNTYNIEKCTRTYYTRSNMR